MVGIVTDRDIVIDALARDLDPGMVTVGDLESPVVTAIPATAGVGDAMHRERRSSSAAGLPFAQANASSISMPVSQGSKQAGIDALRS